MRMQTRQSGKIVALILLISCLLWNCGDQNKASKPPVVNKKISVQSKPAQTVNDAEVSSAAATEAFDSEPARQETTASVANRIYDPKQRLNPFIPLFKADNENVVTDQMDALSAKKRKKRIPQTPLEKISLNQLNLVAIIRASSGNKALVEESSGKGYIVKKGTYIGLNSGIVTQIDSDGVIIEEEIENLMGELVLQNTEIKLQKPAGE